jgi:aerobic-type carbon monoxide dehydrogenase small subunit (CoxS/CutS family)
MDVKHQFTVNGTPRGVSTDPQRPLLDVLREDLHLTGTKYGCGEGQCGACGVLLDGKRIFACQTPIKDVAGKEITTIEGLCNGDRLHPVQQAFLDEGAFQCGYCTAGMIVATAALLAAKPHPTRAEIVEGMNGNICRCCTYAKIQNAVQRAAGTGAEVRS